MAADGFRVDIDDGIATITFNRPEAMNTLNRASAEALAAVFDRTDADDNVRVVIVTGEGRAFCAGADVSGGSFSELDTDNLPDRDWGGVLTLRIFDSVKPVIAAVNGVAAGVGATLQLPMDVRIASSEARLGFVFTRRGIMPESGSLWFLPRLVGISQALDWNFLGRVFSAQEALEAGLVRSVHAPEDLMPAARALARTYADGTAPVSVALARRMMWRMMTVNHPREAHLMESSLIAFSARSPDVGEGISAFLEKRKPDFVGRVSDGLPDI